MRVRVNHMICTTYTVQCILYSVYILRDSQCTSYSVQCMIVYVQCTAYSVHRISILYYLLINYYNTLHYTQYVLRHAIWRYSMWNSNFIHNTNATKIYSKINMQIMIIFLIINYLKLYGISWLRIYLLYMNL